jgi:hypothetical protein
MGVVGRFLLSAVVCCRRAVARCVDVLQYAARRIARVSTFVVVILGLRGPVTRGEVGPLVRSVLWGGHLFGGLRFVVKG